MEEKRVFQVSGARPYVLRYGLTIAPALLTLFGGDTRSILLWLGGGLIVSGVLQWCLAHWENEEFLSTMWTAGRAKLQTNRRAKTEREREKQLAARRQEAVRRAKREGKSLGLVFAGAGIGVVLLALIRY